MWRNTANSITFHYKTNSVKINDKFLLKLKKPIFGQFLAHFPNFWRKKSLFQKHQLCHAQPHKCVYHHAKIQRNLMIQFQENTRTDSRMEGRTDPISQDLSSYCRGSNKYNCSRLAFKSQRYRVHCWSNQKLLHHSQHAKNQLNSYTHL